MKEGLRKYRVIGEYRSPYPTAIIFRKGEQVEIGKEFSDDPDWKNWVWCQGKDEKQAWAPIQFLMIEGKTGAFRRDYNALELSVTEGEELVVHEEINGFGLAEKADGKRGWVPLRNLVEIKTEDR